MTPSTVLLLGFVVQVVLFLAQMLYFSGKIGEYKNKVDTLPSDISETKRSMNSMHERFDAFYKSMMGYENRLGQAEGQLKRMNGGPKHG